MKPNAMALGCVLIGFTFLPTDAQWTRQRYADEWPMGAGVLFSWANNLTLEITNTWPNPVFSMPFSPNCSHQHGRLRVVGSMGIVYDSRGGSLAAARPTTIQTHNKHGYGALLIPMPGSTGHHVLFETHPFVGRVSPGNTTARQAIVYSIFHAPDTSFSVSDVNLVDTNELKARYLLNQDSNVDATIACDGKSYWLGALLRNKEEPSRPELWCWLLTQHGIRSTAVRSHISDSTSWFSLLRFSPNGSFVAIANHVYRFDIRNGTVGDRVGILRQLNGHSLNSMPIAFSADETYVFASTFEGAPLSTVDSVFIVARYRWNPAIQRYENDYEWHIKSQFTKPYWGNVYHQHSTSVALGPDSAIYVTHGGHCYRLQNATALRPNGTVEHLINNPRDAEYLLAPNFVSSWYVKVSAHPACRPPRPNLNVDTVCVDSCITITYTGQEADSIVVELEGAKPERWTTVTSPCVIPPRNRARLRVIAHNMWGSDTLYRTIRFRRRPIVDAGPDIVLCANRKAQLLANAEADSVEWSPADGLDNPKSLRPWVSADVGTKEYRLTAYSMDTCIAVDSVRVSVHPFNPSVSADTSVCEGGSIALIASGGHKYVWSPSTGLSSTSSATVIARPPSTTRYRVIMSDSQCSDTLYVTVTVHPVPEARLPKTVTACRDAFVRIAFDDPIDSTVTSITWLPGHLFDDSTSFEPILRFTGGMVEITARITHSTGCTRTVTTTVNEGRIEAGIEGPSTVCAGAFVEVVATPPGATYRWLPEAEFEDATSRRQRFIPKPATEYHVVVTSGACMDTARTTFELRDPPRVRIDGDTVVCRGDSVRLRASGADEYEWFVGDELSGSGAELHFLPSTSTTVICRGRSVNQCESQATRFIRIQEVLDFDLIPDTTICMNDTVILVSDAPKGIVVHPETYVLYQGNTILATPQKDTRYVLSLPSNLPCSTAKSVQITVRPRSQLDIVDTVRVCAGDTVWFPCEDDIGFVPDEILRRTLGDCGVVGTQSRQIMAHRERTDTTCGATARITVVVHDREHHTVRLPDIEVEPGTTSDIQVMTTLNRPFRLVLSSPSPVAQVIGVTGGVLHPSRHDEDAVIDFDGRGTYRITLRGFLARTTSVQLTGRVDIDGHFCSTASFAGGLVQLTGCNIQRRMLQISTSSSLVRVYDLMGRCVTQLPVNEFTTVESVTQTLPYGMYIFVIDGWSFIGVR
jgi:hypothetical protein